MSRRPTTARRSARRPAGDRLRGLLSLLVILALLVGVPAALIALRGNPLPDSGTSLDAVLTTLTRPDDGSLFLAALTWIAWIAWASFTLTVLVEVAAQVRGLPSPHLPALGGPQRIASALVATAMLLLTSPLLGPTPALAAPTADASAGGQTQQATPPVADAAPAAPAAPVPAATPTPVSPTAPAYTVQPGDSLWQIAEEHLGDGARFTQIAALNYGVPQPDGRALTADHWLSPGWQLQLPADQRLAPAASTTPATTVVVEPGDTLWEIAQDTLGDGSRFPQIAAASTGLQPDGGRLTDPDLIRPGWELTVPGAAPALEAPAAPAPPVSAAATSPTPPPQAAQPPASTPGPATAPAPVSPPVAAQPPTSAPSSFAAPEASAGGTSAAAQDDTDTDQVAVRTAAGVGGLLAAGLLVLLGARRARQQRRRRPGERIAMPAPELFAAELELRQVEDPVGVERVDRALRTLSLTMGERGQPLPPLRMARLIGPDLQLYLGDAHRLPAPFTPTDDPTVWTLPADGPLAGPDELADVPAPYPSLVTIGHDLDGAHVLLDLEHSASLSVDGDPGSSVAVLAAIAAELATSLWADDLQVTLVGCLPELPAALGTARARYVPNLEELLPSLERRAAEVRAALAADGLLDLHQARTSPSGQHQADTWTPEIILLAGAPSPQDRHRLDAILQDLPRVGVAAVSTASALSGGEWTLLLDQNQTGPQASAVLNPVGLALYPQRLSRADLDQLLALLAVADLPSDVPAAPTADLTLIREEPSLADLGARLSQAADDTAPAPAVIDLTDLDAGAAGGGSAPDFARQAQTAGEPTEPPGHQAAPAAPAAPVAPQDPTPEPQEDGPPAPLIQVLGPVEVLHPRGAVERSKQRQLTEMAAYLALHPGHDHAHLSEAIWPGARTLNNTRNTALSKLRKWLGTDPDGSHYVPRVLDDGYRLHPAVTSDWQLWQDLLPGGPAVADTPALAAALELVKGKPFAGTNPRRYAWAERDRQNMVSAIVDVAHELARRALLEADATLARHAAAAGLQADPGAELLWRDALRAEWLAGDINGLTSTADRLSALADELGDDLEPETVELLDQLLRRPHHPIGTR